MSSWRCAPRPALLPLLPILAGGLQLQIQLAEQGPDLSTGPGREGSRRPVCSNSTNDGRFLCTEPPGPLRPLVLVKTHKTGGTTAIALVNRLGDRRNMKFMTPPDDFLGFPGPFPGRTRRYGPPAHQYGIIAAHVIYDGGLMREYAGPSPFFITLLREPGAQAISAFNYAKVPPWGYGRSWDTHVAWLETAEPNASDFTTSFFLNSQANHLGWYQAVGHTTAFDGSAPRVRSWLSTLERDFVRSGLVMLTEYFDEGLVLLKRRLGLELHELRYLRMNEAESSELEPTEELRERARSLNPVDVELYAYFNRTFQEAWAAARSPEVEADLANLRRLNAELQAACEEEPLDPARCPEEFWRSDGWWHSYLDRKEALGCEELLA